MNDVVFYLIVGVAVGAALGIAIGYFIARSRTIAAETLLEAKRQESERLQDELALLNSQYQAKTETLREKWQNEIAILNTQYQAKTETLREKLQDEIAILNSQLSATKADNARLAEQLRQESEERAKLREESTRAFNELSTNILAEQSKTFKENNEARLAEILAPFRENIETLRKTINDCYMGEVSEVKSLKESLKTLAELNSTIGREAKELTGALRGNSKVQGDWGEMILRQLLEKSGLEEGLNYTLQATTNDDGTAIADEEGSRLRPDVVFHLPEGKNIVIDSKVSLTAYTDYVNAADEGARAAALKEHLASVRRHIDELAAKRYDTFVKNAADFVMMFVPNESAYIATMQADDKVWDYAYGKRIVLVSPTHLMSVIQLMSQLWTQEKQNRNAQAMAVEVGRFYDKLEGLAKDFEAIQRGLEGVADKFEAAWNKLRSGKGNLLLRADNLRKMGAKTNKNLSRFLADDGDEAYIADSDADAQALGEKSADADNTEA